MHNSIRQRTHGFRGMHGSVSSAYSIMKGLEIYYNFVKKHEALKGKSPSELANSMLFLTHLFIKRKEFGNLKNYLKRPINLTEY